MSWQEIGFQDGLVRQEGTSGGAQQLDPQTFDQFTDSISGSKIVGGSIISPDGKTNFNVEEGTYKVNNGVQDLLTLGVLPDGSIGLQILDNDGNILMQVSAELNMIRSKTGNFLVDLDNARFVFFDDRGVPQGVFGEV